MFSPFKYMIFGVSNCIENFANISNIDQNKASIYLNHWLSDMVAFPDSEIEPTMVNGIGLTPPDDNRRSSNDNVSHPANDVGKIKDQAFTISRLSMSNYSLKFDNINMTDKKLGVDINPEPVIVQKVAGKKSCEINSERE